MKIFLKDVMQDQSGATAIEYGLIASLIAVAAITAMSNLGSQVDATFNSTSAAMSSANSAGTSA